MHTHISKVELSNYRSCVKTKVEIHSNLSALIGPNGSGKSNFLNGLMLLKRIARRTRREIDRHLDENYTPSTCRINATFVVDEKEIGLRASISYETTERNTDEIIDNSQLWNLKEITGKDEWLPVQMGAIREAEQLFRTGANSTTKIGPEELREILPRQIQYLSGSSKPVDYETLQVINPCLRKISDFLLGTNYYGATRFTDPSRCPPYFEIENETGLNRLGRSATEHLQFMYDLYLAYKNQSNNFHEFVSIVGNKGIGLIDSISYEELEVPSRTYKVAVGGKVTTKELKRTLVIPNFITRNVKLSPNQLSEGTFKTLALVFYLITDNSRLLLLEEPEVCVHHGLLSSVLELIKTFSQRKQIIFSTHSDFILDGLQPDNVFVVRNESNKGTIIRHIPSSMSARDYKALKNYLNSSGNLGEYWRHGDLETA